jgi:hypothetical protein
MPELACALCGARSDLAAFHPAPSPLKGQFVLKCPTCCKTFIKREAELPERPGPTPRA